MSDLHCPARIIVARHGEAEYESPEMNATGGSLTTLGRSQAHDLGERLRSERVAGVVCSELSRAVQTAEIAAGVLGLPVRVRERLQEFPAGDYLGRPYDHAFFNPLVTGWLAGDLDAGVPGGETGRQTADPGARGARRRGRPVPRRDGARRHPRWRDHGAAGAWSPPGRPLAPKADGVPNCSTYVFERDADGWRALRRPGA